MTAGGGFLLAVLWFDLMFDVLALGHRERELQAVRLGARQDRVVEQSSLARSVLWGHVYGFASIAGLLVVQLAFA